MSAEFNDPALQEQITHVEEIPPRDAKYREPRRSMHPMLRERLNSLGIEQFYSHQAAAYDLGVMGKDVLITTGTNSGKTMCYNLPALQACLIEPAAKCLYLFPTKALAQDQLGRLDQLTAGLNLRAATYDGDTPQAQRSSIRKLAHIVLTNPDMVHLGMLPANDNWAKFFKSLRVIVIDEMHMYRGVFGSNVANVLRRLLRLCEWHRSRPQIIGCSATIGNPVDLFQKLTGRTPELVDEDGSPHGKRTYVFWNPPMVGENQRLSANVAASEIMANLAEVGQRTLTFSRARVSAELVLRYTRKRLQETDVSPDAIDSYRAGYTAKERRQIEQALFKGKLLGLSATNAMELGVDVGALDAVVMNGYPGTASSFWQQAGRAGRGTKDGLAVFVAHDDALEQFLVRRPDMLLGARNESVGLNPENRTILTKHLLCAAHERPLAPSELSRFGESALELAESMDRSGELKFQSGLFFYPGFDPPAPKVNIRGMGGDDIRLLVGGELLATMDRFRAMTSAHEGAVYLHRGQTFVVQSLDLVAGVADVVPMECDYYTSAIVSSTIDSAEPFITHDMDLHQVGLAGVKVTDVVDGYRKRTLDGGSVLSYELLEFPPTTYETDAVRFDLDELHEDRDLAAQLGAIHGLEHALMAVAPLLAGCDRADLGSSWYSVYPTTLRPAVFLFDKTPGGVGLVEKLFDNLPAWLAAAEQLLTSCECEDGCPACLYSPRCEALNEQLHKKATVELLHRLREWV